MKIRCMAIDDEPIALEKLKKYIEEVPFLELVAACRGTHEASAILDEGNVDAVFIDINMPDVNGMDFVKNLENPPLVVFSTAYSEYAVESYKVNAVDYLLKPYDEEDFRRAADNVLKQWNLIKQSQDTADKDFVYLKTGTRIMRVAFEDIEYIEGMNEYLKVHPLKGDPYLTYATFKNLMKFLPDNFTQVHRSYVVNMNHVLEIEKSMLKMRNGATISLGGNYKDVFMLHVKQHLVLK